MKLSVSNAPSIGVPIKPPTPPSFVRNLRTRRYEDDIPAIVKLMPIRIPISEKSSANPATMGAIIATSMIVGSSVSLP